MPRKSSSSTVRRRSTSRRGKRTNTGRTTSSKSARGSRRSSNSMSTRRSRRSSSSSSGSTSSAISPRTRKAIDTLPSHAQKIYTMAYSDARQQYSNPSKARGDKRQSNEQVAHKVAWFDVKKEYKK